MTTELGRVLLTTGSRSFERKDLVEVEIAHFVHRCDGKPGMNIVIHGGARGADRLVSEVIQGEFRSDPPTGYKELVEVRVPYLGPRGKKGGHERNVAMVQIAEALEQAGYHIECLAFHADINNMTPGTKHMVGLIKNTPWSLVHINGEQ